MSAGEQTAARTRENALFSTPLAKTDPQLAEVIALELTRQRDDIELIASENYVSRAGAITVAASSSTWPKPWLSSGLRSFLDVVSQTSRRIPAPPPMWRPSWP